MRRAWTAGYKGAGQLGPGLFVVLVELAVEHKVEQVVLDRLDPGAGGAAKQGHQVVAV